jgi:hypothetical protein
MYFSSEDPYLKGATVTILLVNLTYVIEESMLRHTFTSILFTIAVI